MAIKKVMQGPGNGAKKPTPKPVAKPTAKATTKPAAKPVVKPTSKTNGTTLRKQVMPSPDARKPKRDTVKRELTPEEMGVITRKQKNQATVGELKSKGVSASTLAPYLKRLQMSTDSANVVYQKAWGPKKGK
jgi:hypothetical protein